MPGASYRTLAFVEAGKLKGLGVTTKQRSSLFPDIPAIGELLPGYEVALWNGIVMPANTVPLIVPETLDSPIRRRYETGTSVCETPRLAAFTCISTVQP